MNKYLLFFIIGSIIAGISVSCSQSPATVTTKEPDYRRIGDSIIKATFDTLRHTLGASIQRDGVEGAVQFCNVNAYPITGTLASEKILIKRVANRYRNPQNAPDSTDAVQWNVFATAKAAGDSLQPAIVRENDRVHYYKPIILQANCTVCHGTNGKDISPAVASTIDSLYPNDNAKDFAVGDLRGMWKISFLQANH